MFGPLFEKSGGVGAVARDENRVENRPTVGVALSSGGASSLAQIGVLEKFAEAGVAIDAIAGTSAGSIVGAALSANRLPEFRDAACALTWRRVFRLFNLIWPRSAFLDFRAALDFVRPFVPEDIESLDKPFAAVAVDLLTGEEVVLRSGNVIEAIRASCSIPGVFSPCRRDGRWLADGALANPLPVNVVRELGASFAIAVNVLAVDEAQADQFASTCRGPTTPKLRDWLVSLLGRKPAALELSEAVRDVVDGTDAANRNFHFFAIVAQASRIVQSRIAAARLREEPADFLVNVPVGNLGVFDFHRTAELVEAGRRAAEKALPELERALSARSPTLRLRHWWRARRGRELSLAESPVAPDPSPIIAAAS
jgi:NTE family protein